MTFLPIVERELRVAARKKSTYWTRTAAASLWFVIAGLYLVLFALTKKLGAGNLNGHWVFAILSWMAFIGSSLAGVFFTSDTLSEEKREGTLGLLFLTDLRGYDVVLGKSLSTSLQAFYALLAVVPIFALPMLFGGVSGDSFWKMMILLVNALFFSLAVGIFVSSLSLNSQRSATGTLLLLLLSFALPPMFLNSPSLSKISMVSPATAFLNVNANLNYGFWEALIGSNIVAWLFLAAASLISPRSWQQKASATNANSWARRIRFGSLKFQTKSRAHLIEKNPVLWLAARERWQGFYFKLLFLGGIVAFVILLTAYSATSTFATSFLGGLTWILSFLLQVWIATQASQFFVDGKQSGALELLLCTPLPSHSVIKGQWLALRRAFLPPLVLLALLQLTSIGLHLFYGTGPQIPGTSDITWKISMALSALVGLLDLFGNAAALAWFGMCTGLTTRKTSVAIIKSYAFVNLLPMIAISISQGFIMVLVAFSTMSFKAKGAPALSSAFILVPPIVTGVLTLTKNIIFIHISQKKLFSHFRALASNETIRRSPVVSAPVNSPPLTVS